MKSKLIASGTAIIVLILVTISIIGSYKIRSAANDQKKIDRIRAYTEIVRARGKRHKQDVKIIHETGEYIRLGDKYSKDGMSNEAANAYKKAYSLDRGFRAVSGLLLANEYEKLSQFDEGISLLDQMIQNGELSSNGVKNANIIKSRLLAAKNASQK